MTDREAMKLALEALEEDPAPLNAIINAKFFLYLALEQPDVIEAAVLAEREACAKVCESLRDEDGYEAWGVECAAAIRARMK